MGRAVGCQEGQRSLGRREADGEPEGKETVKRGSEGNRERGEKKQQ